MSQESIKLNVQPYMYGTVMSCIKDGLHMKAVDIEGYCNLCGYIGQPSHIMQEEVRSFMLLSLKNDSLKELGVSHSTSDYCTELVRITTNHFGKSGWFNSTTHWVWPIAQKALAIHRGLHNK